MDKVYARLLRISGAYLREERSDHTLDAAALVNEAFLRLVQQSRVRWQDRAHFFSVAARLMRRVLLDHARRHGSLKRGHDVLKIPLEDVTRLGGTQHPELVELDDALRALEAKDPQLCELVVMRYFGGMSKEEVGAVLGVSSATAARRWRTARAWLYEYLRGTR